MLFPIIRVRDNAAGGTEHIIGENSHDVLYISKSGGIQYVNIQCMEGTKYPEEGYSRIGYRRSLRCTEHHGYSLL